MSKDKKDKQQIWFSSSGGERMGCITRFLMTAVIMLAILLVTVFFVVGTEGGRSFVQDWIGKYLGVQVEIANTGIGWPYVLVIDTIATKDFGAGLPGFHAREVRVGMGIKPLWRVSIKKGELRLVKDKDNNWQPAIFGRLGDLPARNITELSRMMKEMQARMALKIRDSSIEWCDDRGATVSLARGISFDMIPVKLADEKMCQFDLSIYNVINPDGVNISDIERNWLASSMDDYIEIRRSDREKIPALARAFWFVDDRGSGEE